MKEMEYDKETRSAYRNVSRAERYQKQFTDELTWARFTMWRERTCVEKALGQCGLSGSDIVLDIPCGTGILASTLSIFPFRVVASDISAEMMAYARDAYAGERFYGFVQADLTRPPFTTETFACIIILGFMHRVPREIRRKTLAAAASLSKKFVIVSYSIDSYPQRLKKRLITMLRPSHGSAPSPVLPGDVMGDFRSSNLRVRKAFDVATFLSAEVVYLLEKKPQRR